MMFLAILCFVLAGFDVKLPTGRGNLTAIGLALWAASTLIA
jgi:hypothetical protein